MTRVHQELMPSAHMELISSLNHSSPTYAQFKAIKEDAIWHNLVTQRKESHLAEVIMKNTNWIAYGLVLFALVSPSLASGSALEANFPCCATEINRPGYALSYDHRTKNASWVYERLTADNLAGNIDRGDFQFMEDLIIERIFRSTLQDYKGSGFDRGHLAPAADHKRNSDAMASTFYLSNVSPQCPQFNRGYWAALEKHVRNLTKKYSSVEVFTGPLYMPQEDIEGNRWVIYQVIGKNNVAVPTHYYKVLALSDNLGAKKIDAYIIPNQEISLKTPLSSFQTTLEKVQSLAGIKFFPNKQEAKNDK